MIELFGQTFDLDNPQSTYFHGDCMEGMAHFPDKYFDLAVVDPPYGEGGASIVATPASMAAHCSTSISTQPPRGGAESQPCIRGTVREIQSVGRTGGTWAAKYSKKIISWDHAPSDEYFAELFRISREQIIWGGNYFMLPPNRCFLIWQKTNIPENFTLAMVEYAWCSFNENAKLFNFPSAGQKGRFHPTQKPVELYSWIFGRYAERGMKVLDTHVGSASSLIAAHDAGLTFVGFELDDYYYEKSKQRLDDHMAQMNIYDFLEDDE